MTLVVVRHLPTEWNVAERLQGRADIGILPLTDAEEKIVEENRAKLNALGPFDEIFCSSLKRTQETARLYGYEPKITPLLDEFDFGRFEGLSRKEFMTELGEAWIRYPKTVELGESMMNFEKRVREFLSSCQSCKNVLVFGHGCWCRAVKAIAETGDIHCMNQTVVRNNEVLVFRFVQ